ncbi:MAG: hypothetical protein C4539_10585 [Ignavibacteriales bacterium]|nr:MAG: hypothetical protein C4539_10585 [Ignavibacteriales bacterium]
MKEKKKTKTKIGQGLLNLNFDFYDGTIDKSLIKFRVRKDIVLPLLVERDLNEIRDKIRSNFYSSPYVIEKTIEAILNLEEFRIN